MEENPKKTDTEPKVIDDGESLSINPGLLPYAHTVGSAVIKPEDMGKVKGRAVTAMRQQTDLQMAQLYKQMELLAEQARKIKRRVMVSERIYSAAIGFEPLIGQTYFLYERKDGTDLLSLVAPWEWGRRFPFSRFLAKVTMLADHTWDVEYN
jgi:hypothetical protein